MVHFCLTLFAFLYFSCLYCFYTHTHTHHFPLHFYTHFVILHTFTYHCTFLREGQLVRSLSPSPHFLSFSLSLFLFHLSLSLSPCLSFLSLSSLHSPSLISLSPFLWERHTTPVLCHCDTFFFLFLHALLLLPACTWHTFVTRTRTDFCGHSFCCCYRAYYCAHRTLRTRIPMTCTHTYRRADFLPHDSPARTPSCTPHYACWFGSAAYCWCRAPPRRSSAFCARLDFCVTHTAVSTFLRTPFYCHYRAPLLYGTPPACRFTLPAPPFPACCCACHTCSAFTGSYLPTSLWVLHFISTPHFAVAPH